MQPKLSVTMTIFKEEEDHAMAVSRAKFELENANKKRKVDAAMLFEGRQEAHKAVKVALEAAKAAKRKAAKHISYLEKNAQQSEQKSAEARANLKRLEEQEYHISEHQRTDLQVEQVGQA